MDVQELIGEVARRHNTLVDPHDPILVTVTLNEILLAKHVQKLHAALEQANRAAASASRQQVEDARRIASRLLADGARSAGDEVRTAGAVVRGELEHMVRDAARGAHAAVAEAVRSREVAQWSAGVAVVCASLTVATLAGLWFRAL